MGRLSSTVWPTDRLNRAVQSHWANEAMLLLIYYYINAARPEKKPRLNASCTPTVDHPPNWPSPMSPPLMTTHSRKEFGNAAQGRRYCKTR